MQGVAAGSLGHIALNDADAVTIVDAGAIPLLVQLKPGPLVDVRHNAALALQRLAANSENAVTIATAGAIPPLAQLLRSGADDNTKDAAADALQAIRNGVAANRAAVAAAKASAGMAQAMEGLGVGSPSGAQPPQSSASTSAAMSMPAR
jgi:vacuolar protein 8